MASQHTQHYQLSQWRAADQVLRTDFNADNAVTDLGLYQALKESRTIRTVVLEEPETLIDLSLEDLNWAEWTFVGIEIPYYPSSSDTTNLSCHPNLGELAYCSGKLGLMNTTINPFVLILLPMRDPERTVSSISLIQGGGYGYANSVAFKNLTSLRILYNAASADRGYPAGQKILIWGVR